jgi:hypothetical protein
VDDQCSIVQRVVLVNTTVLVYLVMVAMQTNIGKKEQVAHMYLLAVCSFDARCVAHAADATRAAGCEQQQRKCTSDLDHGGSCRVLNSGPIMKALNYISAWREPSGEMKC